MSSGSKTVIRRYIFSDLSRAMLARISDGRTESAKVWMHCRDKHRAARQENASWPKRNDLQSSIKGRCGLHSQSAQMVCHAFLGNVDATYESRRNGDRKARYPWRDKRYYPLLWPAQAVAIQGKHIILPMGKGRKSIVLPLPEGFVPGGCKLVWNGSANELHVSVEVPTTTPSEFENKATIDLGQIHQCAVTTDTGEALIVSGRGQRSLKRRMNKMHGEISRLQSRCKKGSRRHKKLARARHKHAGRIDRQIRDLAHKGTRAVVDFCVEHRVGDVFIGDPHGVRKHRRGRKHNQRMSQWEYGRDKNYLHQKLNRKGIASFTGSERGTSSRCPQCGHKHKPKGRVWRCKQCGFTGHRDLVGSVNMHEDNFEKLTKFPSLQDVTYLRPRCLSWRQATGMKNRKPGSSSRPDTGRGRDAVLLSEERTRIAVIGRVSSGTEQRTLISTEVHPHSGIGSVASLVPAH